MRIMRRSRAFSDCAVGCVGRPCVADKKRVERKNILICLSLLGRVIKISVQLCFL